MRQKTKFLKELKAADANKEVARTNRSALTRPMLCRRRSLDLAVAIKRQTPEQQRQYNAAVDGFLAEWVRQHLGPQGK